MRWPALPAAVPVLAITLALAASVAPAQQTPGEGECASLITPGRAVEHAFRLPGGSRAVLRDPYGGLVFRNRLFVSFAVKAGDRAQRAKLVDHVEWRLDGDPAPLASNRGGPYALLLPSTKLPAGDHSLSAHVLLRDGTTADQALDLRVTDCQPLTFFGEVTRGRAAALAVGSGGPGLRGVGFSALAGVRTAVSPAARGRAVGTLSFFDGTYPYRAQAPRPLTLRVPRGAAPRRAAVLLRRGALAVTFRPGRRDFLLVTGLPADTRGVRVTLRGLLRPARSCPVTTRLRATVVAAKGGAAAVDAAGGC